MILVTIVLLLFLGNVRAALIVALTIPFSLLFASIWLNLSRIPAKSALLGALDFGMVVDGAVVMVENTVRHLGRYQNPNATMRPIAQIIRDAAHEVQRPVFTPSPSSSPPTCRSSRCQPRGRPLFRPWR